MSTKASSGNEHRQSDSDRPSLPDSLGNTVQHKKPATTEAHTNINDLPLEIFIHIFSYLEPTDLRDLILVCRKWNLLVRNEAVWVKAFDNRLQTGRIFASVTRSSGWLSEYFGRVATTKTWAKAKATSHSYQLINDRFAAPSRVYMDFKQDRLLEFSTSGGSVALCSLKKGRNQVFLPSSNQLTEVCAYDTNFNYLVVSCEDGKVFLRNLITAKSGNSTAVSLKELHTGPSPVKHLRINSVMDPVKSRTDIIGISHSGVLMFWNMSYQLLHALDTGEGALFLDTDFKSVIVIVRSSSILVVDYNTAEIISSIENELLSSSSDFAFDSFDKNIVVAENREMKVYHIEGDTFTISSAKIPDGVSIFSGKLQTCENPRNTTIAGGDGLLYALTFSDGTVGIYNIRGLTGSIPMKCRITQFGHIRYPLEFAVHTKVALNSSVVAIGAFTDCIHFYDAHSGRYLRESTRIPRGLMRRHWYEIVRHIELSPDNRSGMVVCGNIMQYFSYGESAVIRKRPSTPSSTDTNNRRAINQHIKTGIAEYDEFKYLNEQQENLADKYNGTLYENEQEELRMALALSASVGSQTETSDDEFTTALTLSAENQESSSTEPTDEVAEAINLSLADNQHPSMLSDTQESSEDEALRRVLELSLVDF